MEWKDIFLEATLGLPASDDDIAYLNESVLAPLADGEIAEVNSRQQNPFRSSDPLHDSFRPFDPAQWEIPRRQFPNSFSDFLRWSNGGNFVNGEREFGMFDPQLIREYLLAYNIPEYMPGAIPFALDGGGGFYLFDMRNEPSNDEYPIVFAHSSNLSWDDDDYAVLAESFPEVCKDDTNPNDALWND